MSRFSIKSPIQNPGESTRVRVKMPSYVYNDLAQFLNTNTAMARGILDAAQKLPDDIKADFSTDTKYYLSQHAPWIKIPETKEPTPIGPSSRLVKRQRGRYSLPIAPKEFDAIKGLCREDGVDGSKVRTHHDAVRRLTWGDREIVSIKEGRICIRGVVKSPKGLEYPIVWNNQGIPISGQPSYQKDEIRRLYSLVFLTKEDQLSVLQPAEPSEDL